MSSGNFDEWFDVFVEQLSNYGVDRPLACEFARTASEMCDFDPFLVRQQQQVPEAAKRKRVEATPVGASVAAKATNPYLDDPERNPDAFVEWQIKNGKWKLVTSTSTRENSEEYAHLPAKTHTYEFVVDAFEKSTYNLRDVIKAAGFRHFSSSDWKGWKPFKLPGGVKGFGRPKLAVEGDRE